MYVSLTTIVVTISMFLMSDQSTFVDQLKELKNERASFGEFKFDPESMKKMERHIGKVLNLFTNSTFMRNPNEEEMNAIRDFFHESQRQTDEAFAKYHKSLRQPSYLREDSSNVDGSYSGSAALFGGSSGWSWGGSRSRSRYSGRSRSWGGSRSSSRSRGRKG
uniref:Uncharacterized protein n=2 Tax=Panagrolaimus sp. JU765 TaxID=591449 RepID=A0AC34PZA2_9BILA